jgi:hypothetical protein
MPDRRRVVAALVAGSLAFPLSPLQGFAKPPAFFGWRSSFWRCLHQTLYAFASHESGAGRVRRIRLDPQDVAIGQALTGKAALTWARSVQTYARSLSQRNLLFDDGMIAMGRALDAAGDRPLQPDPVLPVEVAASLTDAGAVYRQHWWDNHRTANDRWRAAVQPLVDEHARLLGDRLVRLLGSPWPLLPLETSLVPYANSAGAYTVLGPTAITIATLDPSYQEAAALEMLMHEASHALARPLRDRLSRIIADVKAQPGANAAAIRPDLWHEVLFYVAGRIATDAIPGYVPYADHNDLWNRAWPGRDREVLARHLDPLIALNARIDAGLPALVADLASGSPQA